MNNINNFDDYQLVIAGMYLWWCAGRCWRCHWLGQSSPSCSTADTERGRYRLHLHRRRMRSVPLWSPARPNTGEEDAELATELKTFHFLECFGWIQSVNFLDSQTQEPQQGGSVHWPLTHLIYSVEYVLVHVVLGINSKGGAWGLIIIFKE